MRVIVAILALATTASCAFADPIDLGPGRQPQLAIDSRGRVLLTFARDRSIYLTSSSDNGKTFADPVKVADVKHMDVGMRRGPRIALTRDAIVISAIIGERGGGQDGDLLAWRSTNGGKTWSQPVKVSDAQGSAREGLHALASDGESNLLAVWLDLRSGKAQVFGAPSRDGGKTFEKNQLIYQSPDGHVCECCHPSAAFAASGNIHVIFRNWLAGKRDMWHIASQDAGKTFANASPLDQHAWKLHACPMDGGAIVADEDSFVAAYRSGQMVYLSAGGKESVIGEGTQPTLALGEKGIYCAWLEKGSRLMFRRPFSGDAHALAERAIDPVLAGNGKSAPVLAWENENHVFVEALRE